MLDKIDSILKNQCNLDPSDALILGLSGGPDSLCLLYSLHQLGYPLVAMHINHKLRPEADGEVAFIRQHTNRLGVELLYEIAEVMNFADERGLSVEEAARHLRYQMLFEQARVRGAKAVVVGHNADDQVETILLHFLRGSGLSGLRGMDPFLLPNQWSLDIPLVRPLLSTRRSEILKFLEERRLDPIIDRSNNDITYYRNRIRHELIPMLREYAPSIDEEILRMGEIAKDDYWLLQNLTDQAWNECFIQQDEGYLLFRTGEFVILPKSIQRYLLRRAMEHFISGLKDVEFSSIERGRACVHQQSETAQTELVAGLRLVKEGEHFWVTRWNTDLPIVGFPTLKKGETVELTIPSVVNFQHGWCLEASWKEEFDPIKIISGVDSGPFTAWLDPRNLKLPLIIRTRKPGDKIDPLGMDRHMIKISDVMVNLKLPARVREMWPLVCSGEKIVWMPGYRISEMASLKPDTKTALYLKLSQVHST